MTRKYESRFYKTMLAVLAAHCLGMALTNGPAMPEYNDFEPIDATDVVNLTTGEFNYSFPIMTVPGPGIGFPLVLNYHSGILPKQEASWVGLGWNLQAGSITRQVNTIPDDFKGDPITESILSSTIHGWMASISLDGASVGVSWDNSNGLGGMIGFTLQKENAAKSVGAGLGVQLGYNGVYEGASVSLGVAQERGDTFAKASIGITSDGSVSASAGKGAFSGGVGVSARGISGSVSMNSLLSSGATLDTKGSYSPGILGYSLGVAPSVSGSQRSAEGRNFFIPILIPTQTGIHLLTLTYKEWRSWIEGVETNRYYGFLYADHVNMECDGAAGSWNCSDWANTSTTQGKKKHELVGFGDPLEENRSRGAHAKLMGTSEDVYIVATQGISGVFKPFRKEDGDYTNQLLSASQRLHWQDCFDVEWLPFCDRDRTVNRTMEIEKNRNLLNHGNRPGDIYWRYMDDMGGAEYTDKASRDDDAQVSFQAKKITPHFVNGKIAGFEVRKEDGVTYIYSKTLKVLEETRIGKQVVNADDPTRDITTQKMPGYAYAWLLTGIESPDYFPAASRSCRDTKNSQGGNSQLCMPGPGDGGGWVRFTYGSGDPVYPDNFIMHGYSSPFQAYNSGAMPVDRNLSEFAPGAYSEVTKDDAIPYQIGRSALNGVKQVAYLTSVETPTHKAVFELSDRLDAGNSPVRGNGMIPHENLVGAGETELRLASSCVEDVHGAIVEKNRRVSVQTSLTAGTVTDVVVSYMDYNGIKGSPTPNEEGLFPCGWEKILKRVSGLKVGPSGILVFTYSYPTHNSATPDEIPHKYFVMMDPSDGRRFPFNPLQVQAGDILQTEILGSYVRSEVPLSSTDLLNSKCRAEVGPHGIPNINYRYVRTITLKVPDDAPAGTLIKVANAHIGYDEESGCASRSEIGYESDFVILPNSREVTYTYSYVDNYRAEFFAPLDGVDIQYYRAGKGEAAGPTPSNPLERFSFICENSALKKLDRILLKNKTQGDTVIASAKFTYDYSLCPNTPNSLAANHGKLTLAKVEMGVGESGPFLPPYRFKYQNPQAPFQNPVVVRDGSTRNWVSWEAHQWDRWGFRCTNCNETNHEANGNDAVAWNLENISLPSGGSLKVEYEPNQYSYLISPSGAEPVVVDKEGTTDESELLLSRGTKKTVRVIIPNSSPPPSFDISYKLGVSLVNANALISKHELVFKRYRIRIEALYNPMPQWVRINGTTYNCSGNANGITCEADKVGRLDLEAYSATRNLLEIETDNSGQTLKYEIYAVVERPPSHITAVGGGIRAKSVSITDPITNRVNKTTYTYENGVIAVLPPSFSDFDDNRLPPNTGYEFYSGGSSVQYGTTTVRYEGKGYYSKFHFLTPKDLPVRIGNATAGAPDPSGSHFLSVVVQDFSSLWGTMWKQEGYNSTSADPVSTETGRWIYNSQLDELRNGLFETTPGGLRLRTNGQDMFGSMERNAQNMPYVHLDDDPGFAGLRTTGDYKYFGLYQKIASHRYFWDDCLPGNCSQSKIATTQVVVQRFLPQKSHVSTMQDGLTTNSESYYPDFRTGLPLKTKKTNSDGQALVTELIPAYTRYANMRESHQWTQPWASVTYSYPSGRSSYYQDEVSTAAVSAQMTKWRPFSAEVSPQVSGTAYRISETMAWRNSRNGTARPFALPDDRCAMGTPPILTDCTPGNEADWISGGRNLVYDAFGRVEKSSNARGAISEQGYAYDRSLPVFYAEDTQDGGILFESFEHLEYAARIRTGSANQQHTSAHSKTGAMSLEVQNTSLGSSVCFEIPKIKRNIPYTASVLFMDRKDGTSSASPTQPGMSFTGSPGCSGGIHPYGDPATSVPATGVDPAMLATGSKQWKRLSMDFTCPDDAVNGRICLHASQGRASFPASVFYDELRIRPKSSFLTTMTYDAKGNLTSSTDAREVSTFYEYDVFGNLSAVRNDDGKILTSQAKLYGRGQ